MNINWKRLKFNWDILAIGIGYPIIMLLSGLKYPQFNAINLLLVVIVGLLLVILRMLTFRYMSFYTHEWKRKVGRGTTFLIFGAALLVASILGSTALPSGFFSEAVLVSLLFAVVILFYSDKRQHFTARQATVSTFKPRNPKDLN